MLNFTIPTKESASEESKAIFSNIEKGVGFLPNLFAYIGHSSNALGSYLTLQQAQSKSVFSKKEQEAVFLAVSEENGCVYCQSAHTAIGKMNGFSEEEIIQLRDGSHPDKKLNILTNLAKEIQQTHGKPSERLLNDFFSLGYEEKALVDLVLLIADKVFANYIHNITKVKVDFPLAPVLETATA